LDSTRLAAARLTSQVQSEEAQAKRDALQLQRQEALARRKVNQTRASARGALLAYSAARHPAASGFRAGRLIAEVINAKVPNRTNADGHVLQAWKEDDFFRCELEIEHLLGSTAAAVSAEPVWREKLVMPVLESSSSVAVRLLLRTFRGTNVEWEVIGSHQLLVASLVTPTVSPGEDAEWIQVFAKRWPSKPDLVPTANLRIKFSYVQHVPDQVAADQDLNSIQKFSMPQPVPGNLASHIQPPPGPDAGGPAAPRPRNAAGGSHRSEQSTAVSKGTQHAAAVAGQGLHLHAEQDFVDAGAWLRDAGFQHHAVKDLMARLREAKSLFLSALREHKNQSGHGEGDLLPTPELRKYLSMMGYLDDEIQNVLEDLDPEDTGFISLERFLLKGSLILDGYGAFDQDLRSDMISGLVHKDSSREAARAAAMESPHAAATHPPLASSKPGEAWGQVYVAVVSATDLAMSGSCTLAVVVSLVVDPPGYDAETSAEGAENASNKTLPRVHSHDPFDGRVATELKTGYVDAAGPVRGVYEWNEDMMFALPLDPQKFADVLSQKRLERRQRVGLAVEVQERLADGATRLVGHTRIELTEGKICRALEEARHYDKPFRLSSGKDVCVRVLVKARERGREGERE
jgi:hypothetical protein